MKVRELHNSLKYLGRIAQRSDSRIRRQEILDATLRIIDRDGIRGVRHRSVAREAGVPLAATTYYFEDMSILLHDAFVHYVDTDQGGSLKLEQRCKEVLLLSPKVAALAPLERFHLVEMLVNVLVEHLRDQLSNQSRRNIEMAFRHESLRNEILSVPFKQLYQAQFQSVLFFFEMLGNDRPQEAARLVLSILLHLEFDAQLFGADDCLRDAENAFRLLMRGLMMVQLTELDTAEEGQAKQ